MELTVYLWVDNISVFIRNLIQFFKLMHPNNKIVYEEKYYKLDDVLDRSIYLGDTSRDIGVVIDIDDYCDISYALEEYGTDVNVGNGR